MHHNTLPFARGTFWSDGLVTLTDTMAEYLLGRVYRVNDTVHDTGNPVWLRIVRNDSDGSLTTAYRPVAWATAALDIGRAISGFADDQGERCKMMDDAYVVGSTWLNNDLGYVVESGPCYGTVESTTAALAQFDPVCTDATGYIDGTTATTGDYVIGVLDAACTTTSEAVVIHCHEGLLTVL